MFDIAKSFKTVKDVLAVDSTVEEGIESLIDFCAEQSSWDGWAALKALDYKADQTRLQRWVKRVLIKEPPKRTIKAFWFGLYNPIIKGNPSCGMYIAGARQFDPEDTSFEWACGPAYFPSGRYAKSKILDEIYKRVNEAEGDVPCYGEYVLCLGYSGLAIKHLAKSIAPEIWLGTTKNRAIAVGFDSGDGALLGTITQEGWEPNIEAKS